MKKAEKMFEKKYRNKNNLGGKKTDFVITKWIKKSGSSKENGKKSFKKWEKQGVISKIRL